MYEFSKNDVYGLAAFVGADTHEKGDELFFRLCPHCQGGQNHDKDTFSVNLQTGAFKCFRASCDYHGHFVELARDVGYRLSNGEPTKYRTLPQKRVESKPAAVAYLESRGISAETTR